MRMLVSFHVKSFRPRRGMAYNDYNEKVLEHFNNPRNVGRLDKDDPRVGTGIAENPAKGDLIRFQIMIDDESVITDAKFKAYGCGSAIASASVLTTLVIGHPVQEMEEALRTEIIRTLGLTSDKKVYATLAEEALHQALEDVQRKQTRAAAERPNP